MSTTATSGSRSSTSARASATLPPVPTTSQPCGVSSELEPLAQGVVIFDEEEADRQGPSCIGRGGGIRKGRPPRPTAKERKERTSACACAADAAARIRMVSCLGQGHREAHPPALADLLPDGGAAAGHRHGDPARRRGLLRHDRGRLRPALLRRPRGARVARHPAHRRQARRRLLRAGELLARARGLPPAGDRVHRRRARRAADRAVAARRRVRLRRAAAARAPADHLGPPEPARPARAALGRRSASPRRPAATSVGARLAKIDTAIYRRKRDRVRVLHDADAARPRSRKVDPYQLLFEGGQFYLVGHSHERGDAARLPAVAHPRQGRLRDEGRARLPAPRRTSTRASTPTASRGSSASRSASPRSGSPSASPGRSSATSARYGELEPREDGGTSSARTTRSPRLLIAWALGFGEHARVLGPPELVAEARERLERIVELPPRRPAPAIAAARAAPRRRAERRPESERRARATRADAAIRPERFARLVTLASVLIEAGRARASACTSPTSASSCRCPSRSCARTSPCSTSSTSAAAPTSSTPRSTPNGEIEVDPEPYSDTFDRPARLLPIEAKALVAAIDLIGEHLPAGSLNSAREKIVAALGEDPVREGLQITSAGGDDSELARVDRRRDRRPARARARVLRGQRGPVHRPARIEPYALINGARGLVRRRLRPDQGGRRATSGSTASSAPTVLDEHLRAAPRPRPGRRHRGLAAHRRGPALAPRPRVDLPRAGALGARGAHRRSPSSRTAPSSSSGPSRATDYLVKEVLKEAGDAAVLEPADAREAVRAAAERLLAAQAAPAGR